MTKVDEHIKASQDMLNWIVERCYELEEENKKLKEMCGKLWEMNGKLWKRVNNLEEENKKLKEQIDKLLNHKQ